MRDELKVPQLVRSSAALELFSLQVSVTGGLMFVCRPRWGDSRRVPDCLGPLPSALPLASFLPYFAGEEG